MQTPKGIIIAILAALSITGRKWMQDMGYLAEGITSYSI